MNKNVGNAIVIILQIISAIGLAVVIYLLYKAYTEEKKVVETSSQFTHLESQGIGEEEVKVTVNKQEYVIKHEGEGTIINGKKIDFYAMKVYTTNSILILSSIGQQGEELQFYDKDLNKLYDSGSMQFSELNLENGKLTGSAINSTYMAVTGYAIENVWVVPCDEEVTTNISKYKKTISKHEKEILEADYIFSYDTELIVEIPKKETIGDMFGEELEHDSGKYCVIIE